MPLLLPFEAEAPLPLQQSKSSTVLQTRSLNTTQVIKYRGDNHTSRLPHETNEHYAERRIHWANKQIADALADERRIANWITQRMEGIDVAESHWIIAEGKDGYAIPINTQTFIPGPSIREYGFTNLSKKRQNSILDLLYLNNEYYRTYGVHFDLIGSIKGESKLVKLKMLTLGAIMQSTNIIVNSQNERLTLVDTEEADRRKLYIKYLSYCLDIARIRVIQTINPHQ